MFSTQIPRQPYGLIDTHGGSSFLKKIFGKSGKRMRRDASRAIGNTRDGLVRGVGDVLKDQSKNAIRDLANSGLSSSDQLVPYNYTGSGSGIRNHNSKKKTPKKKSKTVTKRNNLDSMKSRTSNNKNSHVSPDKVVNSLRRYRH